MKKSSFISALGIGILSIGMAFASPADAVGQIRQNATQVLTILKAATRLLHAQKPKPMRFPISISNV